MLILKRLISKFKIAPKTRLWKKLFSYLHHSYNLFFFTRLTGKLKFLEELKKPFTHKEAFDNFPIQCFQPGHSTRYPEFAMPDGSTRTTFATSSGEKANYPSCIRDSSQALSEQFDHVFSLLTSLLEAVASVESLQWRTSQSDSVARNFSDLEIKVWGG